MTHGKAAVHYGGEARRKVPVKKLMQSAVGVGRAIPQKQASITCSIAKTFSRYRSPFHIKNMSKDALDALVITESRFNVVHVHLILLPQRVRLILDDLLVPRAWWLCTKIYHMEWPVLAVVIKRTGPTKYRLRLQVLVKLVHKRLQTGGKHVFCDLGCTANWETRKVR